MACCKAAATQKPTMIKTLAGMRRSAELAQFSLHLELKASMRGNRHPFHGIGELRFLELSQRELDHVAPAKVLNTGRTVAGPADRASAGTGCPTR